MRLGLKEGSGMSRRTFLKLLGGFNEEFAKGHSFDDNEILLSIKKNLNLNIKTIEPNKGAFVIHQWHARDAESKITKTELSSLLIHNKKLCITKNQN